MSENELVESKYGFKVGEIVTLRVDVSDECYVTAPAGSRLRIVAIAPKVRVIRPVLPALRKHKDTKEYFLNAVREGDNDYGPRFRINFVTIKKLKEGLK